MLEPLLTLILVLVLTPLFIRVGFKLGLTGVDLHKLEKPIIPKTGGLAIIVGVAVAVVLYGFLGGDLVLVLAFLLPLLTAGLIGFVEDVRGEINPKLKPLLLIIPGAFLLVLGAYVPRPVLPFIGGTRLYRIYPVMVLAAYPVVCNAVNSLDVLNGSMAFTSLPFFMVSGIIAYLRGDGFILTMSLVMLAALLSFLFYNNYPSKVFAGNSGSLAVGASIASIAIIGRIEVAAIIALLPHIMNEMHVIFSIGGLKSAKTLRSRPIEIVGEMLTASKDRDAPITLTRMITAGVRAGERDVVKALAILTIFTAVLALLTDLLLVEAW